MTSFSRVNLSIRYVRRDLFRRRRGYPKPPGSVDNRPRQDAGERYPIINDPQPFHCRDRSRYKRSDRAFLRIPTNIVNGRINKGPAWRGTILMRHICALSEGLTNRAYMFQADTKIPVTACFWRSPVHLFSRLLQPPPVNLPVSAREYIRIGARISNFMHYMDKRRVESAKPL